MISWGGGGGGGDTSVTATLWLRHQSLYTRVLLEVSELSRRILHTKYCEDSASTSSAEK